MRSSGKARAPELQILQSLHLLQVHTLQGSSTRIDRETIQMRK